MHVTISTQPSLKLGFGDYTCNWGGHFCGLYETDQERDDIVMGFLHQGVHDGDLQLYCPVERSGSEFLEAYASFCGGCGCGLGDPGHLQVMCARDLYYPDGVFSPWTMDDELNRFFAASQEQGPRNIRASAEMAWALEAIPGVEDLMAYESRLNYFISGKPWISICLYNLRKFSGAIIMNALRTHPFTISKGVLTQNPYFENPDTWLAAHAPQYLDRRSH